MTIILPIHLFFTVLIFQALRTSSLPEEAFFGYPLQTDEEYVYLDSRADPNYPGMSSPIKQSETRRRSILDKNFARFGRSGGGNAKLISVNPDTGSMKNLYVNDEEVGGLEVGTFGRNPRSGERNDQFIRFGRGKNDFLRFGRTGSNFVRFGRSTRSIKKQEKLKPILTAANRLAKREDKMAGKVGNKMEDLNKMAVENKMATENRMAVDNRKKRAASNLEYFKKGGSNFVRFGRDRNDNFMRFGRMMSENYPQNLNFEGIKGLNIDKPYNNTAILMKYLQNFQEQQGQKENQLLIKLLFNLLYSKKHQTQEDNNPSRGKEENRCS